MVFGWNSKGAPPDNSRGSTDIHLSVPNIKKKLKSGEIKTGNLIKMLEGNLTLKYPIFVKDGYEALGQNALERAGQKSGKLQRTYITLAEDYFVKAGIPDETRELAIGSFERSAGTRYRTESRPDDSRREVYFGRLAPAMVISGLVLGILFLQSNITGNTIADMDSVSTGWGVSVLILIGVLGLFLYSRKKK